MTFDGAAGTWSAYPSSGGTEFSANEIACKALYSNGTTLYLGYAAKMSAADWRAAVMTCQGGGSWGALGATANFSTATVDTTELDIAGSGSTLYFVYLAAQIATVCKYQSGWTFLGTGGAVQASWVTSPSIGVNSAGTPYVAYHDGSTGCARMRKYDSGTSSWVDVGSSTNVSDDTSVSNNNFSVRLCMDGNTPYVAYQDDATKTIFVKKYDGTQWVIVGGQGIACVEGISHVSLVVKAGVPHLAFIRKAATPVMNAWKCD